MKNRVSIDPLERKNMDTIIRNGKINIVKALDDLYNNYIEGLNWWFEQNDNIQLRNEYNTLVRIIETLESIGLLIEDEGINITMYAYEILEMYESGTKID